MLIKSLIGNPEEKEPLWGLESVWDCMDWGHLLDLTDVTEGSNASIFRVEE
jgi:hypothetical protein